MRAYSIDATNGGVKELDIEMKANSVYSFFGSILIDELSTLNKHMIYTDANALSEGKSPFFLGEQLLIGDALIVGKEEFTDLDATIPKEELESLIVSEVSDFYKSALNALAATDLNLYRTFVLSKKGEEITLNTEWVLYTFNIADDRTKEYFLVELTKALNANEDAESFMQKMAGLALNAGK